MKKIFTILAAAVAAFSLASCNKEIAEEIPAVTSDFMVDITVPGLSGAETKAVKSSWVEGDKLNIWFDGAYWNELPQLVLTYDGAQWNASEMDKSILQEAGTFNVIYEASNSEFTEVRNNSYYYFPYKDVITSGTSAKKQYAVPMSCYQNGVEYTYSEGKLTANISSWRFLTMIQVVVTGLPKSASSYALKIDGVQNTAAYAFHAATGTFTNSGNSTGGYSIGVQNKDGVAFYFGSNSKPESRDLVFTLKERLSEKEFIFTKTSTALSTSATSVKAVKIDFGKFYAIPIPEAVDLGLSVKWASFNVGAAKPEDYGYYFAWGETTEKTYYGWLNEGDYKWGIFDYRASPKYGMTKYTADVEGGDGLKTLQPGDDPATANLGSKWRTPTVAEIKELFDKTKCEWTWDATKKGITVKGLKTGNSIFLPAAGYRKGSDFEDAGSGGSYWSSSVDESSYYEAYYFYFRSMYFGWGPASRYNGYSVRAVTD